MADQLVSEYRLVDGTNPRLRFASKKLKKYNEAEIANPVPIKLEDIHSLNGLQLVSFLSNWDLKKMAKMNRPF
jgi:hypothetical protein